MFTTEQISLKTSPKTSKNRFYKSGIPLAKEVTVKYSITYKEITLILGVVVAVLVALTLWVIHPAGQPDTHASMLPDLSRLTIARNFIYSITGLIF